MSDKTVGIELLNCEDLFNVIFFNDTVLDTSLYIYLLLNALCLFVDFSLG